MPQRLDDLVRFYELPNARPANGLTLAASTSLTVGKVVFVARPELASTVGAVVYARPDDVAFDGRTWRQHVLEFNEKRPADAQALLPAYQLYANPTYRALATHFGLPSLFILSAGWGLIPANFRIPLYDITFSAQADSWKVQGRGRERENRGPHGTAEVAHVLPHQ